MTKKKVSVRTPRPLAVDELMMDVVNGAMLVEAFVSAWVVNETLDCSPVEAIDAGKWVGLDCEPR